MLYQLHAAERCQSQMALATSAMQNLYALILAAAVKFLYAKYSK